MQYEVGVVRAHPVAMMWKSVLTIWRTWRHARAQGVPCNRWYGVYHAGSEIVVAHFGPLPDAARNARLFVETAKP